MYAKDVGCLENEQPCLGEPQLLFEVSKTDQGPKPPVAYSVWSPDGKQVALGATGVKGQGDVFVGDLAGKNWTNLTNSPNFEGEPAWSPDGLYISYSASSGDPDYVVKAFIITPAGKKVDQLLKNLGIVDNQGLFWTPHGLSWSPNGQQVVFMHSDENGYYQLYIANPDGSELKQLTDQPEDHFDPHFSPDGKWIVATRELGKFEDTQQYEIILFKSDGSGETKVIYQSPDYLFQPVWSPIGNWIAFLEGGSGLNIIRSDGTGLMKISDNNARIFAPAWRKITSP
jgi:TolB protein